MPMAVGIISSAKDMKMIFDLCDEDRDGHISWQDFRIIGQEHFDKEQVMVQPLMCYTFCGLCAMLWLTVVHHVYFLILIYWLVSIMTPLWLLAMFPIMMLDLMSQRVKLMSSGLFIF